MVCVLSGGQIRGLRRELESEWEVRVLMPMWETALPQECELVIMTDRAVCGSFGAADACRRMLLSATCRGIPTVFVLLPGAEREGCRGIYELMGFARGLVCRKSEAVRLLGAPAEGTDISLRRRHGLEHVRLLPATASELNVWRQLIFLCHRLLGDEQECVKKLNQM